MLSSFLSVTFHGGRHAILRSFTAADALALMEREGVTVTNVASTMLTLMVMHPLAIAFDLSSLRLVSCGGSMQSPAVVAAAIALFGCEVFVSYGMTEACGKIAMSLLTDPDDPANVDSPAPGAGDLSLVASSGRPFTDMDIRVIDEQDQDVVPDGVAVGEIVIKGPTGEGRGCACAGMGGNTNTGARNMYESRGGCRSDAPHGPHIAAYLTSTP